MESKLLQPKKPQVVPVTETPEFKRWFAGSRVVDSQGKPLRVYHFTVAEFDQFRTEGLHNQGFPLDAAFFTDSLAYIQQYSSFFIEQGQQIIPVYLSLKNPLLVDLEDEDFNNPMSEQEEIGKARSLGNDGVVFRNKATKDRCFAVFHANQIKSAIGNNGQFDPESHSITAASDDEERAAATQHPDDESYMRSHNTGWLPSHAYNANDNPGMFQWQQKDRYPKLLKRVTLKDGRAVELRQEGKKNQYCKTDSDGEIVRDEKGLALYLTEEEAQARNMPLYDTAIMVFDDQGECVAQASDEWGADLVAVRPDYQGQGLGTILLGEFRRQFKHVRQMGQMTDAGANLAKSYYRSLTNPTATAAPAQPKGPKLLTLYRGLSAYNSKNGVFYTSDAEWARQFTQSGQDHEIRSATIPADLIYAPAELPYAGDLDEVRSYIQDARDHHCKAIRCSEGNREPDSFYVFDQTALTQTGTYKSKEAAAGQQKSKLLQKKVTAQVPVTETPEFRRWFAGSKVVDAEGEPLQVFHGSDSSFGEPRPLTHFGTLTAATSAPGYRGILMRFYLDIKNPFQANDSPGGTDLWSWLDDAKHQGVFSEQDFLTWERNPTDRACIELFESKGYDGIRYVNEYEDKGSESWVIFRSEQARLVGDSGAKTSSDRKLPDVLYHYSPEKARKRINSEGLRIRPHAKRKPIWEKMENNPGVYACDSIERLNDLWPQNPNTFDIWAIQTAGLRISTDEASGMEGSYCIAEDVPPSQISLVHEALGGKQAAQIPLTETPEFKGWFAGSEVVDAHGKPQVMYHATQSDIDVFRPFTHFGTQQAANDRHQNLTTFFDEIGASHRSMGANIVPVYLSVKNPIRLPDLASIDDQGRPIGADPEDDFDSEGDDRYPRGWEGEEAIAATLLEQGIIDIDEFEDHRDNDEAMELLKTMGYDGIVYENAIEDPGSDSWIVFSPHQIKSAIGNNGQFSANHSITAAQNVKQAASVTSEELEQVIAAGRFLWLDDIRVPLDSRINVVRSYDEFVAFMSEHGAASGAPLIISFDHDLSLEHYPTREEDVERERNGIRYELFKTKTGKDCAEYIVQQKLPLTYWGVHSASPTGRRNILNILSAYRPEGRVRLRIPFDKIQVEGLDDYGYRTAKQADGDHPLYWNAQHNEVLNALRELPYADRITVFGSVARDKEAPGDVDILLDLRDLTVEEFLQHPAKSDLLTLARKYYGGFDPFVRVGRKLFVRDDQARGWMSAKNARGIWSNIQKEGKPLSSIGKLKSPTDVLSGPANKQAASVDLFPAFDEFVKHWGGLVGGITSQATAAELGDKTYDHFKAIYDGWVQLHSKAEYPRTLYRAIQVESPEQIRTDKVGTYWAWDEDFAHAHMRKERKGQVYILKASVPFEDIDWMETIHANMEFDTNGMPEREIRLKERVHIEIEGCRPADSYEFQPFHVQTVTANKKQATVEPIDRDSFNAAVLRRFKEGAAEDNGWKQRVMIHHGCDSLAAQKIIESGYFESGADWPSFFTTRRKEALDYARMRAKQLKERGKDATPHVFSLRVDPWAVHLNKGSDEVETHLLMPLYVTGNNGYIKDEDILAALVQINPSDPTVSYEAYLQDHAVGGEYAQSFSGERLDGNTMVPVVNHGKVVEEKPLKDMEYWPLLSTYNHLKRKRDKKSRELLRQVEAWGMKMQAQAKSSSKTAATFGPVYHGTPRFTGQLNTRRYRVKPDFPGEPHNYRMGAYFTESKSSAENFAGEQGELVTVQLAFKKPLDLRHATMDLINRVFPNLLKDEKEEILVHGESDQGYGMYKHLEYLDERYGIVPQLKTRGYDGMIFPDSHEGTTYVAFNRSQIQVLGVYKVSSKQAAVIGSTGWAARYNSAEIETLRDMYKRAEQEEDFTDWLRDLVDDETEFASAMEDEDLKLDYFADWLHETHQIGVEEHGLVEFWKLDSEVNRLIGDLPVVVYHHTSNAILDRVRKEGLRADVEKANGHQNTGAGVYVTTECSGAAVSGYLRNATQHHGGDEISLPIRTHLWALSPDPDDEDIQTGAVQFILPYVPPQDILFP